MKRKKYSEIITKEDRQEFLDYMLQKELEKIRLKMYKYKRREVLWNPISIEEHEFDPKDNTAGQYIWNEETEEHKILIDSSVIDRYIKPKYSMWYTRKRIKEAFYDVIGHEILHAYAKERFKYMYRDIKHVERDASPVFLALLQFLGYTSGHQCETEFILSPLWIKVDNIKTDGQDFNAFLRVIVDYREELLELKEELNNKYKIVDTDGCMTLYRTIDFEFSSRGIGLNKAREIEQHLIGYSENNKTIKTVTTSSTTFEIGSSMDASRIRKIIDKKMNNGIKANLGIYELKKLKLNEDIKNVKWLVEKKEEFNIYADNKTAHKDYK